MGFGLGFFSGLAVDYALFGCIVEESVKGNYIPVSVFGTANVLSGVYELRRLFNKRNQEGRLESRF